VTVATDLYRFRRAPKADQVKREDRQFHWLAVMRRLSAIRTSAANESAFIFRIMLPR